jgi:hypothetical protein
MAATVEICESNGVGETISHNISTLNFGDDDSSDLTPASFPIVAGDFSFEKWIRVHVTAMGSSNKIDNCQMWKESGNYVTGETIECNLVTGGYSAETYSQPIKTDSAKADTAMPTADPGTANIGIGGSLSGNITTADEYSDYVVIQMGTTVSTPGGDVNQKSFKIQYDEQ